jgi:hypothetical protein
MMAARVEEHLTKEALVDVETLVDTVLQKEIMEVSPAVEIMAAQAAEELELSAEMQAQDLLVMVEREVPEQQIQ